MAFSRAFMSIVGIAAQTQMSEPARAAACSQSCLSVPSAFPMPVLHHLLSCCFHVETKITLVSVQLHCMHVMRLRGHRALAQQTRTCVSCNFREKPQLLRFGLKLAQALISRHGTACYRQTVTVCI